MTFMRKSVWQNINGSFHAFSDLYGPQCDNAEPDVMSTLENILVHSSYATQCRQNQQT
jgi:hypothetical protein